MLARFSFISALLLFALNAPLLAQEYSGKFADHPNLEGLQSIVAEVAEKAPKKLPKWLVRKTPTVLVTLVDAEQPLGEFTWPGKVARSFEVEPDGKSWKATINLPVDSLIRDLGLVEPALKRLIFGVAAFRAELASGVDIMSLGEQGLDNPIIDAIAAHWAGSLDEEIDYGLRRHLEDIDRTMGLVSDIELSDNGGELRELPAGDLTLLMLARVLAPKKDTKLEQLFASITRKQPLKQGLEKASGKKMKRLNEELHKALAKRLKSNFIERDRERYQELVEAYNKQDWSAALEADGELKKPEFLAPNLGVFTAICTCELAKELEMKDELHGVHLLLGLASMRVGATPFAAEAQLQLAKSHQEAGDKEAAEKAWITLRDDFGWQPGWAERATQGLEALND